MNLREILDELLASQALDWDEEERARARAVAADLDRLLGRKLVGEDVESELLQAQSAAASIASERAQSARTLLHLAATRLSDEMRRWLLGLMPY